MRARIAGRLACFVLFCGLASSALAQHAGDAPGEFGTQDGIDLWIPASRFTGASVWLEGATNGYFFSFSTEAAVFHADLPLPQGALLDSWRAFYYDGSATNDFTIGFVKWYDDTTATPNIIGAPISGFTSSGSPGFKNHHEVENKTIDLREPSTVTVTRSEAADFYTFYVVMPPDAAVQFKGVRVIWHRQVSPAPATATFNDVPTSDPAFQYIEALVAAGITAGCNTAPPMYCPDGTLTRRQMAVFLSKALGLHWPNF